MATENEKLMDLLEKLTEKVSALESKKVGNNTPIGGTTPIGGAAQKQGDGKGPMAWRQISPKDNEPKEKTVEGKIYRHCATCRQGKGLWTTGEGLHGTEQHDPTKSKKK